MLAGSRVTLAATVTGGIATSATYYAAGNNFPYKAFDGSIGNANGWGNNGTMPEWLKYDFTNGAKIVTNYSFYCNSSQDGGWNGYFGTAWTFEGSNSAVSDWVVLDTKSGRTIVQNVWTNFPITNVTAYDRYRIRLTTGAYPGWCYLTEMEFGYYTDLSPVISNKPAVGVSGTNASLVCHLVSTGEAPCSVFVYWGTTNAGTNLAEWTTNVSLGGYDVGYITNTIFDLIPATRYYFAFYASNATAGRLATPSGIFSTLGGPVVNNAGGVTDLTWYAATLQGEVMIGNPTPDAYIFWGPNNGDTNKTAWLHAVPLGAATNWTFSTNVTLTMGSTNYYRCYASNSLGEDAWASDSVAFTSLVVALTQCWDTAAGVGIQGGTGTWNTIDANWSLSPTGTALGSWGIGGSHALFVQPSNGAASLIILTNSISAGSVLVTGGVYSLIVTNGGKLLAGSAPSAIGANASNNLVVIAGGPDGVSRWDVGSSVSATQKLTIGFGATGSNNVLLIDGAGAPGGAMVANVAELIIGYNGAYNRLVLTNGGMLANNTYTYVGLNGNGNSVTITGPGSIWSNGGYRVFNSHFNRVTITDGGRDVLNGYTYLGYGGATNSVSVTGTGSTWLVTGGLVVGNYSTAYGGNSLAISNGGTVLSAANTRIGGSGSDNLLLVTDAGSVMTNLSGLNVGYGGTNDNMVITNGGRVVDLGNDYIGYYGNQAEGAVLVTGDGSVWSNVNLTIGLWAGKYNSLKVANRGRVATSGMVEMGGSMFGYYASNNTATVTDTGSVWQIGGILNLGYGKYNSLIITNGGRLAVGRALVGCVANANSNIVTVTGAGSLWDLGGASLTNGNNGTAGNIVLITRGGTLDGVGSLVVCSNNYLYLAGGMLGAANAAYTNEQFVVGDGVQSATLKSIAGGTLAFMNGLLIASNATLAGFGTVGGGAVGIIVTNGATLSPGSNGPGALTIGGSNLTWNSGGIFHCEITNLYLGPGFGWDLLNVSSQLNLVNGPGFVIRLDAMAGSPPAGFDPGSDYGLRIAGCGTLAGFTASDFVLDTNSFPGGTANWSITNLNAGLYLQYRGAGLAVTSTPGLVWMLPSNGNWSAGENWSGSVPPATGGDGTYALEFGGEGTSYYSTNDQTNAAGQFLLNRLLLTSRSGMGVTNVIAGGTLVFTNTNARVDYSESGSYVISNAILLAADTIFGGLGGGGTLLLASNIMGGMPLNKEGPWTLALRGSNAFVNPVVVHGGANGVVRVDNNQAFGTNAIVVTNGGVLAGGIPFTFGNGGAMRTARVTGNASLWTNTGALTVGSNAIVTADNGGRLATGGGLTMNADGKYVPCCLLITNGGLVAGGGTISYVGSGAGAANNKVAVMGGASGVSRWDLGAQPMYIGYNSATATNNVLLVDGAGVPGSAIVTNVGSAGVHSYMGYLSSANNRLIVTNGGALFGNGSGYFNFSTSSNTLHATGAGSLWSYYGFYINSSICGNLALAEKGGTISNQYWWVRGDSNRVMVADGGRCFGGIDYIGMAGYENFNTVAIIGGSGITSLWNFIRLGANGAIQLWGGTNNAMLVDGAGYDGSAVATNAAYVLVGYSDGTYQASSSDRLTVTNKGRLYASGALTVGQTGNPGGGWGPPGTGNVAVVAQGGKVFVVGVNIGASKGSSNFVNVVDSGSLLDVGGGRLAVGDGIGVANALTIDRGGTVDNVGSLVVRATNYVNLLGGTLAVTNAGVTNGMIFTVGDGTQTSAVLKALGGRLIFESGLQIASNATLAGWGTLQTTTDVYGTFSPGFAIGPVTNSGDFTLKPGCRTIFEVGAYTAPGSGWDYLFVTNGTLALGGILRVQLSGGFVPTNTENYLIMTNTQPLSGTFENAGDGQTVTVYTNGLANSAIGTFRVTIADQSVMLNNFQCIPSGLKGTIWTYF